MSEKMMQVGIERMRGWLYYLDGNLNIFRARMVRGGEQKKPGSRSELLLRTELKRDSNYLYYLDKSGDVCRVKASRGGSARKGKKIRRTVTQREALLGKRKIFKRRES